MKRKFEFTEPYESVDNFVAELNYLSGYHETDEFKVEGIVYGRDGYMAFYSTDDKDDSWSWS